MWSAVLRLAGTKALYRFINIAQYQQVCCAKINLHPLRKRENKHKVEKQQDCPAKTGYIDYTGEPKASGKNKPLKLRSLYWSVSKSATISTNDFVIAVTK